MYAPNPTRDGAGLAIQPDYTAERQPAQSVAVGAALRGGGRVSVGESSSVTRRRRRSVLFQSQPLVSAPIATATTTLRSASRAGRRSAGDAAARSQRRRRERSVVRARHRMLWEEDPLRRAVRSSAADRQVPRRQPQSVALDSAMRTAQIAAVESGPDPGARRRSARDGELWPRAARRSDQLSISTATARPSSSRRSTISARTRSTRIRTCRRSTTAALPI